MLIIVLNIYVCLLVLDTMELVDPGLPDLKGNILKHLSAAQLNLARLDMEENRYANIWYDMTMIPIMMDVNILLYKILNSLLIILFHILEYPGMNFCYVSKSLCFKFRKEFDVNHVSRLTVLGIAPNKHPNLMTWLMKCQIPATIAPICPIVHIACLYTEM